MPDDRLNAMTLKKEAIEKLYLKWEKKIQEGNGHIQQSFYESATPQDRKKLFLLDAVLGLIANAGELSVELGGLILETMGQIHQRVEFQHAEEKEKRLRYFTACNFIAEWLTYDEDEDFRNARFDTVMGEFQPVMNLREVGYPKEAIPLSRSLISWLLKFLNHQLPFTYEERQDIINNLPDSISSIKTKEGLDEIVSYWLLKESELEQLHVYMGNRQDPALTKGIQAFIGITKEALDQRAKELETHKN